MVSFLTGWSVARWYHLSFSGLLAIEKGGQGRRLEEVEAIEVVGVVTDDVVVLGNGKRKAASTRNRGLTYDQSTR